ncbi:Fungalysin metallopeptidase-domain-containing protein [Chytriomyces sp. MP71]|nr:Fungalysin metallopeptidase-domain-containing protein [Chytriomyces sp. MP71]
MRATIVVALASLAAQSLALSATERRAGRLRPFGPALSTASAAPFALDQFNALSASRSLQSKSDVDAPAVATAFAVQNGVSVKVTDAYVSPHTNTTHVYLVQTLDGAEIANAVAVAAVDANGRLRSFYHAFAASDVTPPIQLTDTELVRRGHESNHLTSPLEAIDTLFIDLGLHPPSPYATQSTHPCSLTHKRDGAAYEPIIPGQRRFRHPPDFEILLPTSSPASSSFAPPARREGQLSVPATFKYIRTEAGSVVPVWDLEVDFGNHYYNAFVDARKEQAGSSKKTLSLVDWVSQSEAGEGGDESEVVYERVVEKVVYRGKDAKKKVKHSHVSSEKAKNRSHKQSPMMMSDNADLTSLENPAEFKGVYNVYPLGINDPFDGIVFFPLVIPSYDYLPTTGNRSLVEGPLSYTASPHGWHWCSGGAQRCPQGNHTTTLGNNVYAQENLDGGYNGWENATRPDGTRKLLFDFPADLAEDPETYVDAAVVNLFYWCNAIHDLFYVYGFTEAAGNFQDSNLARGGEGGDAVIANAQDGSGHNNANFATPPDGSHGRMRMYVWDVVTPWRDGDFEGGIIMHEYAHGISTRLTGGPSNSGCLGFGEAGGMGEGWGDWFATITRMTKSDTRAREYGMGEYANGGHGIRKYKYSTKNETNPSVYSYVQKPAYWGVHAKGEVWAEILYEVYWNIVDAHGFNEDWFDSPAHHPRTNKNFIDFRTGLAHARSAHVVFPTQETAMEARAAEPYPLGGNVLVLQLVVDGLKLQPCNPSFVDARDAILTAEDILTGGANKCLLWRAFAKRGLGVGAKSGGFDSFKVPRECSV